MAKTKRKQLEKELDDLWRQIVVFHKQCEKCKKVYEKGLHAHHIFGRNRSVRWDLRNGIALCASCHKWRGAHSTSYVHQKDFHKFLVDYIGTTRLDDLEFISNQTKKWPIKELEEWRNELDARLSELKKQYSPL